MKYPLAVIDFEANGLSESTYPLSVGLAIREEKQASIQLWHCLIRPASNWMALAWDQKASNMHHISQKSLQQDGISLQKAVQGLQKLTTSIPLLISDNPYWETRWMTQLTQAAGFGSELINKIAWPRDLDRMAVIQNKGEPVHRADLDAQQILTAIEQVERKIHGNQCS